MWRNLTPARFFYPAGANIWIYVRTAKKVKMPCIFRPSESVCRLLLSFCRKVVFADVINSFTFSLIGLLCVFRRVIFTLHKRKEIVLYCDVSYLLPLSLLLYFSFGKDLFAMFHSIESAEFLKVFFRPIKHVDIYIAMNSFHAPFWC